MQHLTLHRGSHSIQYSYRPLPAYLSITIKANHRFNQKIIPNTPLPAKSAIVIVWECASKEVMHTTTKLLSS